MTTEACVLNLFKHVSKLNIFVLKAPKQHVTSHTDLQKSQSLALKSHNLLSSCLAKAEQHEHMGRKAAHLLS